MRAWSTNCSLLKSRARSEKGQIAVFFIDDNFAINLKRTKSLLRDIIAAKAQVHWVAQISANLLRDEELVDLIAASGGKWIFIGMESVDPANLKDVNKGFNKPERICRRAQRLAKRNIYAITSFIFGMDNDTTGVAERTLAAGPDMASGPAYLRTANAVTRNPALYSVWRTLGRLTRPQALAGVHPVRHGAHSAEDDDRRSSCGSQLRMGQSYSPEALAQAVESLDDQPLGYRVNIFLARLCFRGIYFPMLGKMAWVRMIMQNRKTIFSLVTEAVFGRRQRPKPAVAVGVYGEPVAPAVTSKISA